MEKIGIFVVGTSPVPIYISMKYYLQSSVDKIFLLATEDDEFSKGSYVYAERLKKTFKEKEIDIEIVSIDRSNLKVINRKVLDLINEINNYDRNVEIYLDFTGGTKLQSAFIRESFERNINTNNTLKLVYVDGYTKKILIKENAIESEVGFDEIEGNDDDENIPQICKLHGFDIGIDENHVEIFRNNKQVVYNFDEIALNEYTVEFVCTLDDKIEQKNWKAKLKLDMFKNIIHSEQVGGDFSILDFKVPKGKEDKYRILMKEFLGIKREIYSDRIYFNGK